GSTPRRASRSRASPTAPSATGPAMRGLVSQTPSWPSWPSCPAYRGCERLRDTSGPPLRLWVFPDSRSKEGADVSARYRRARIGWPLRAGLRDRRWDDAEGGRGRLQRLAGDGAPLVASLAGGERGGAGEA